jgi:hypothetical protein
MPGLDPHQRRLEREAQAVQQNQPPPLDPPFPFQPTAFDPWSFGIENDPPPVPGSPPASSD